MQSTKEATTHEQLVCGLHVHPKTRGIHGLGGDKSHPIDAFPVGLYGPHSIPPSLCPHCGGPLVVEQPLPLGNQGELEDLHCGFVFGFIAAH